MIFMNLHLIRDFTEVSRFDVNLLLILKDNLGMWLDLDLRGTRPKPLVAAAMAAIDQHRALLHGKDENNECHTFSINLNQKVNLP